MSQDTQFNPNVKLHQSVTGYLAEAAAGRLEINDQDGKIKTVAKLTAHTVASTVLALAGIIETAVRHAFVVLAKVVHFVIPKGYTAKFDTNILRPLYEHAGMNTDFTAESLTRIVTNFMSKERRDSIHDKIDIGTERFYKSNFLNNVLNLHINGFRDLAAEKRTLDSIPGIKQRISKGSQDDSVIQNQERPAVDNNRSKDDMDTSSIPFAPPAPPVPAPTQPRIRVATRPAAGSDNNNVSAAQPQHGITGGRFTSLMDSVSGGRFSSLTAAVNRARSIRV